MGNVDLKVIKKSNCSAQHLFPLFRILFKEGKCVIKTCISFSGTPGAGDTPIFRVSVSE